MDAAMRHDLRFELSIGSWQIGPNLGPMHLVMAPEHNDHHVRWRGDFLSNKW